MRLRSLVAFILVLQLASCAGPENLAFSRGQYHQSVGQKHEQRENPISDKGIEEYRKAVEQFSAAIKLNPKMLNAYHQRGRCYWSLGENEKALHDYSQAIAMSPKTNSLWKERGTVYEALCLYDKAIGDFEEALRLTPQDARVWASKGRCELRLGRNKEGLADLDKALSLAPKDPAIRRARGFSFAYVRDIDKMRAEYKAAEDLSPSSLENLRSRGQAEFMLGMYPQAEANFGEALKRSEWYGRDTHYAVIFAALSCRMMGREQQAEEWLERAIAMFGMPIASSRGAADAEVAEHWPEPAIQYLYGDISADKLINAAAGKNDRLTEAYCYIGLQKESQKQPAEARKNYQWVVQNGNREFIEYEIAREKLSAHGNKI